MISTILATGHRCSLEKWNEAQGWDEAHGPVVALWDAGPLGLDPLCWACLNDSLDCADDMNMPGFGTLGEPVRLTWVMHPTADRFCARHCWPDVLCSGWSHGPGANVFGQRWPEVTSPLIADLAHSITVERWQVGMAAPGANVFGQFVPPVIA